MSSPADPHTSSPVDFAKALGGLKQNSEMIREYWRDLRASWQASESALRRTLFYILVLAASFMLLNAKAISDVTLLGFQVKNLGIVVTLIPAVIAYLIYVASNNAAITFRLAQIHDNLAHYYWPDFYSENLELTIRPVGSVAETTLVVIGLGNTSFLGKVAGVAGVARFLIYMAAPIVFEVYALWQLFVHHEEILLLECAVATFSFAAILACTPNYIFMAKTIKEY